NHCEKESCVNGGTCINGVVSFECRCLEGFSGKRCESGLLINSTILAGNTNFLGNLSHFLSPAVGNSSQWLLCHGWAVSTFHTSCDHRPNTVTIIKYGQNVFGGYTDITWDSSDSYGNTSNSFIFSLRNEEELHPFKSIIKAPQYAIYKHLVYGPTFGHAWDIYISDNANSIGYSFAHFRTYEAPKESQDPITILSGASHFSPDDWEVFYLG
ncbi:unnamed protein product, partial [Pocillopora meandrina]